MTTQQEVLVTFQYSSADPLPLLSLEEKLEAALSTSRAGQYHGCDKPIDSFEGTFFMCGPSADRLFQVVRPVLEGAPFMIGATVTLRYGSPNNGGEEVEVILGG